MAKLKNLLFILLAVSLLSGSAVITGCTSYAGEEELKQLNDLRAAMEVLQTTVNSKESEKAKLQKEISDKDAKIKQLQKDTDAAKKCVSEMK